MENEDGLITNDVEVINTLKDETLDNTVKDLIPDGFAQKYKRMQKLKSELEATENQVKKMLIDMFENTPNLDKNYVCVDGLKFTYVKPSVRKSVDSKLLQEEYPEIYKKVLKESNVKSSIRTTIDY